jgi:hypothetical protein
MPRIYRIGRADRDLVTEVDSVRAIDVVPPSRRDQPSGAGDAYQDRQRDDRGGLST